jgi:polysaccharide export outer membrane protein
MKELLVGFLLLALPAAAWAQAPAPVAPSTAASSPYALGPGDVIEIEVLGQQDFGKPRVRIRPDGSVPLPMIGDVSAANLTISEFARNVERRLVQRQLYTAPSVNADIVSYASRYVVALGAVGQPGLVPVDRAYRVSEVLARVGGAKEGAQYVILSSPTGEQRKIAIDDLARSAAADPFVQPNDKLFVPEAETFYIYGQVNAPGAYPVREGMTLRQAIARGGGLTASGSEKKLRVHRGNEKLRLKLDSVLRPGDVLVLGERLF